MLCIAFFTHGGNRSIQVPRIMFLHVWAVSRRAELQWFFSRSSDKWQPAGFAKIRSGAQRNAAHDQRRPRGLRPATARWPTARDDPAARWPCPDFSQFFAHAALNPRGGLSMFNGRRWVWMCLPFNNLNPCFCLLYVVEIKPWKRFLALFIRLFTETDSTKEDFHYRTM